MIIGVIHDKVCDWCGKRFKAQKSHARFCSDSCRALAYWDRNPGRRYRKQITKEKPKKRGRPGKNLSPEVKIDKPEVKPKKKPGWPKGKKRGPRKRSTYRAEKAVLITALPVPVVEKMEVQPEVTPEVKEVMVDRFIERPVVEQEPEKGSSVSKVLNIQNGQFYVWVDIRFVLETQCSGFSEIQFDRVPDFLNDHSDRIIRIDHKYSLERVDEGSNRFYIKEILS